MYGTPYELSSELLKNYAADSKILLVAWSAEDIVECLSDDYVTQEEANSIAAAICHLDKEQLNDIFSGVFESILESMREAARDKKEIVVSVRILEQVVALAGSHIRREDTEGGEGFTKRHFPFQVKALEALREMLEG